MEPNQVPDAESAPPTACPRCGSHGFFDTPIPDTKTSRTFHLYRCKACGHQQWSPVASD